MATVVVAGALRDTLLRLEEARRSQEITQTALDRSEARLRLAQDAGSVGLWDWDVVTGDGVWSPPCIATWVSIRCATPMSAACWTSSTPKIGRRSARSTSSR
uniref:CHASE3 domain-containing protein n=1 Tax=Phenylobacterium glaciei TaxID=2803784 RepID=A0A974P1F6_9CAUL|nr:hypothetical protein JKL49_21350 [Phenylobacterium glaciei]